jgi:hypothetical protein
VLKEGETWNSCRFPIIFIIAALTTVLNELRLINLLLFYELWKNINTSSDWPISCGPYWPLHHDCLCLIRHTKKSHSYTEWSLMRQNPKSATVLQDTWDVQIYPYLSYKTYVPLHLMSWQSYLVQVFSFCNILHLLRLCTWTGNRPGNYLPVLKFRQDNIRHTDVIGSECFIFCILIWFWK